MTSMDGVLLSAGPPIPYHAEPREGAMARKKDCFGSETHVCRTQNCPYVSDCVQVVWNRKLRRILSRKRSARLDDRSARSIRIRSKEFTS